VSRRTLYIVDGYNVLHRWFPGAPKDELFARRDWLVDRVAELIAVRGAAALVVFDAPAGGVSVQRPLPRLDLEVAFAGGGFTADTLIARRIAEQPADVTVVVVSADQEVQRAAARAGVVRMTPAELRADVDGLRGGDDGAVAGQALDSAQPSTRMPTRLEDKVDPETLRRLDELRRKPQ